MDSERGRQADGDGREHERNDDESWRELPPLAIGREERRLQVRAYNCWASLLGDRQFPAVEGLTPERLAQVGPYAVLLDFTGDAADPAIGHIGTALAEECGQADPITRLSEAPAGSLLARVGAHYEQIRANRAPTGFEAEFVNRHGATILYRGILLPFSSDDATIDHVLAVINWKEIADAAIAGELHRAMGAGFEAPDGHVPDRLRIEAEPAVDWADGPERKERRARKAARSHARAADLAIEAAFPDISEPAIDAALARRLRDLDARPLGEVTADGDEFALLVAQRLPDGRVMLLGEVGDDRLLARAAQHLIG